MWNHWEVAESKGCFNERWYKTNPLKIFSENVKRNLWKDLSEHSLASLQAVDIFWSIRTHCNSIIINNICKYIFTSRIIKLLRIGTSYLAKFQKRAVTHLKNYSTKNDGNLRKPKKGQLQPSWKISQQKSKYFC